MKASIRRRLVTWTLPLLLIFTANAMTPQSAAADVDVYITPGYHTISGRQWHTTCSKYSSTVTRCNTDIKATQVKLIKGRYVSTFGWVFNNLTYKAVPRSHWSNNNLGKNAAWTEKGRRWYTECDNLQTGYNGCRSYIWATHVVAKGSGYQQIQGWVFNNMVRFSNDAYGEYSGPGNGTIVLPKGATQLYLKGSLYPTDSGRLIVWGLDSSGNKTDLAFDSEVPGVQAGGAIGFVNPNTVKLLVQANGPWTISVHPLSTAPKLVSFRNDGTGWEVLAYDGPARSFAVTHTGTSRFVLRQWTGSTSTVVADTVGNFSGTMTLPAGPSFVEVETEGAWTIY